jgi:hypothetical protein
MSLRDPGVVSREIVERQFDAAFGDLIRECC